MATRLKASRLQRCFKWFKIGLMWAMIDLEYNDFQCWDSTCIHSSCRSWGTKVCEWLRSLLSRGFHSSRLWSTCVNEWLSVDVSMCKLCLCALLAHRHNDTSCKHRIDVQHGGTQGVWTKPRCVSDGFVLLLMQFFSYRKVHGSLCTGS